MATELASRGIVRVAGEEARAFLERLITCDMDRVAADGARLGALLSPQGKILAYPQGRVNLFLTRGLASARPPA